jgi:PAS domain S-box-containing protein
MRLKTKLVLAITGLVFLVVFTLSWIYVNELLRQRMSQAYAANDTVAHQIYFATQRAVKLNMHGPQVNPNDHKAVRAALAKALRTDAALSALMDSAIRYSPTVFDVAIADSEGRALLSSDPANNDTLLPHRDEYAALQTGGLLRLLEVVFGPPRVYNVTLPVGLAPSGLDIEPLGTIRVGVRTTFLRFVVEPWLITALTYAGVAILCSLVFAAFLANLALKPIDDIGARLDALTLAEAEAGETASMNPPPSSEDAVVVVSHKIERIGRRMRNVEEVFTSLKENLDQIMENLQDGILLYTHDARAVLVSDSVERFVGVSRAEILGARLHDVFPRTTRLGRLVRESFDARMALVQEEITTETGRHVEISLDFIHEEAPSPQESLGALLTLHDVESVREIENDLAVSRRLAAIGRLTAGVGHEVKNPINAIVVHLELLRNKLSGSESKAQRHLEVIESEIQRLDRVVQTLVDFSRPMEVQLKEQDLRRVVTGVLMLASADFETRNVIVKSDLPDHPMMAKIDADLIKQALLNVVLNGAQAMAEGGELTVRLTEEGRMALLSVHDQGSGIPPDVLDKIFDLYFTTKKDGSGIGLAMTYRIMELHNGSIEVESDAVQGTTFVLRLPLNSPSDNRLRGYQMPDGSDAARSIVAKEPTG